VRDASRLYRGFSECAIINVSACNFLNAMGNLHAAILKFEIALAINNNNSTVILCIFNCMRIFIIFL
jgi:hypothetical protein